MFFESSFVKYNFFKTVKKVHSFKVFKKSTKFKKYNRGITKFIMNRKKYLIKKKSTNFLHKFSIPLVWTNYFSKKRQLVRFFQYFYMLNFTISIANQALAVRNYDFLFFTNNDKLATKFYLNSAFITKILSSSNSLFRSKNSKFITNFYKNTKFGLLTTNNPSAILNVISAGSIIFNKNFLNYNSAFDKHQSSLLINSLKNQSMLCIISVIKQVRKIINILVLLNIFNM